MGGIPLFYGFEIEKPEREADVVIELWEQEQCFHQWYGVDYYGANQLYPHIFFSHGEPRVRMVADAEFQHLIMEGVNKSLSGAMELLLAGFYSWLSRREYLLAHASLIEYKGEALMFSAASGVGKTTQAELWKKLKGAEILNGDKVMLEKTKEGNIVAWGSPWRGSSPYGLNRNARLKGIILLEQGKENKIKKLSMEESMGAFFPHIFYPSWDKKCVDGMMNALEAALEQLPVYRLSCKPDEEAVQITYEAVWQP